MRKSVLAADLGKNGDRFKRILDHTEEFTIIELVSIGRLCNLSLPEMLTLVGHDNSGKIVRGKRDDRYEYVKPAHDEPVFKWAIDIIFTIDMITFSVYTERCMSK